MSYFDALENKEQKLFYARLDDLERRANGGVVAHSFFLTPSEAYKAEKYFTVKGNKDRICFFGGYLSAQRKQIFLLPEYLSDSVDVNDADALILAIEDEFCASVSALRIKGSGFRELSHRDYLGSILSLGIERSAIGDICISGASEATVFCAPEVEGLILYELSSVGNDKVKVEKVALDYHMESTQRFLPIRDTVASDRLDCVVAAILNLSRERAQNLIKGGFVEHNYETAEKIDARVENGDTLSARGYGKFIVRDITEETKKGRIRLFAEKYI